MPYAMATMMFVLVFFLVMLIFISNPFERLLVPLADGRGLNALLRDPGMLQGEIRIRPQPVSRTIAFGYSQTAWLLRGMALSGETRDAQGNPVFDGILTGSASAMCLTLNNDATPRPAPGPTVPTFYTAGPCPEPVPEPVK